MSALLARSSSADRQFERLYQRYLADVYRYSLALMRNAQDAEDVTQTTFMSAYRSMQGGERPENPKNWLIAIAHNVCRQRFRQAQRRPQESPLFEDAAEVAVPERDVAYSAEDINRALGQLAFNQRAALVMREFEGRSYAEIAEIMGLSTSAIETVLFRARRALREQLEATLSCAEAERYLSKQVDGALDRPERGELRAHLRSCKECSVVARQQRASRGALKAFLGGIPLPGSLLGGGSTATFGLAAKTAAVLCFGAVVGAGGYEAATTITVHPQHTAIGAASKGVAAAAGGKRAFGVRGASAAAIAANATAAGAAHGSAVSRTGSHKSVRAGSASAAPVDHRIARSAVAATPALIHVLKHIGVGKPTAPKLATPPGQTHTTTGPGSTDKPAVTTTNNGNAFANGHSTTTAHEPGKPTTTPANPNSTTNPSTSHKPISTIPTTTPTTTDSTTTTSETTTTETTTTPTSTVPAANGHGGKSPQSH